MVSGADENVPTLEYVGAGNNPKSFCTDTKPVDESCRLVIGDEALIHGFPVNVSC